MFRSISGIFVLVCCSFICIPRLTLLSIEICSSGLGRNIYLLRFVCPNDLLGRGCLFCKGDLDHPFLSTNGFLFILRFVLALCWLLLENTTKTECRKYRDNAILF